MVTSILQAVPARKRLCAVLLILLAFMPCSAPFSTCTVNDFTAADKESMVTFDVSFSNASAVDSALIGEASDHALTRESAYILDTVPPDVASLAATSDSRSVVIPLRLASAPLYLTTALRI